MWLRENRKHNGKRRLASKTVLIRKWNLNMEYLFKRGQKHQNFSLIVRRCSEDAGREGASFRHLVHQVPLRSESCRPDRKGSLPKCLWFLFQMRTQWDQVSLEQSNLLDLITWGVRTCQLMPASAKKKRKHL